jgi:hypothetical protein
MDGIDPPKKIESFKDGKTGQDVYYIAATACWPLDVQCDNLPATVPQIIVTREDGARGVMSKVHFATPASDRK